MTEHASGSHRAVGLIAAVTLVAVTGLTALFTVPAVAITPQIGLGELLPRQTLAFVTVHRGAAQLAGNPELAGWATRSSRILGIGIGPDLASGSCTPSLNGSLLEEIGPGTTVAILAPEGDARPGYVFSHQWVIDHTVVVAPLDIQLTLAMVISRGSELPRATSHIEYRGVRIVRTSVGGCDRTGARRLTFFVAPFRGYLVAAERLAPIEAVVDTARGRQPPLRTRTAERALTTAGRGKLVSIWMNQGSRSKGADRVRPLLKKLFGNWQGIAAG